MPDAAPAIPNPVEQAPVPKKGFNINWTRRNILILISIIILMIVLIALGLYAYQSSQSSQGSEGDASSQQRTPDNSGTCTYGDQEYEIGESFPADDGCNTCTCGGAGIACTELYCLPGEEEYTGDTVSTTTPLGWTITEYYDGAGTTMLVGTTTYTGLTGLEIKNPSDEIIFSLHAVDGVGGTDNCPEVTQFSDTTAAYVTEQQNFASQVGFDAPIVTDLSTANYTEFNFLDQVVRRISIQMYWDTEVSDTSVFNPACGLGSTFRELMTLGFSASSGGTSYDSHTYSWAIDSTATVAELATLDGILETMTVN